VRACADVERAEVGLEVVRRPGFAEHAGGVEVEGALLVFARAADLCDQLAFAGVAGELDRPGPEVEAEDVDVFVVHGLPH